MALLGSSLSFSTAYHPQTDGQTEWINWIIEEMLWNYMNYRTNDWDSWLALVEFMYNNSIYSRSTISLFEVNYSLCLKILIILILYNNLVSVKSEHLAVII